MTDIDIAQAHTPKPIADIAAECGIPADAIELYGSVKAKIDPARLEGGKKGKLILVTAINPTPLGEGKTTVSVGLADGLRRIGKNAGLALREPSLGPVFGIKGGATGGGYAQVVPMEDINLHFTGDLHAITAANNLLSAMIDNHIFQGNTLGIDPENVTWRRCMDMNDRCLRRVLVGQGGEKDGTPRADGFDITAASEVMAALCLASGLPDLKRRLGNIIVGYTKDGRAVQAKQLKAENAMAVLLKDAVKPNLVQTLEGTPALIHGGPFANIAHGCNSVIATRAALSLFDYTVTEAGFGADLGAEKFLDVKCRVAGLSVGCVVIVATVKALKYGAGVPSDALKTEDVNAVKKGCANLKKHIRNITELFGLNCVVAVNRFTQDSDAEIEAVREACAALKVKAFDTTVWADGGAGAEALAAEAAAQCHKGSGKVKFAYASTDTVEDKINAVVTKVYGGSGAILSDAARAAVDRICALKGGYEKYPVIIAKTQYSLSADPKLTGCPEGFTVPVKDVVLRAGAEFIVCIAGNMMLMPGLPKIPAAEGMDIAQQDGDTVIKGLF